MKSNRACYCRSTKKTRLQRKAMPIRAPSWRAACLNMNASRALRALDALPQLGRDLLPVAARHQRNAAPRWPAVQLEEICAVWADALRRARRVEPHSIHREALSVRETMSVILRTLRSARRMEFTELFAPVRDVPVAIVSFIAILELARIALIEITQAEPFAPLYVQLADASGAPA